MSFPYEHVYSLFDVGGKYILTQLLTNIPQLKNRKNHRSSFLILYYSNNFVLCLFYDINTSFEKFIPQEKKIDLIFYLNDSTLSAGTDSFLIV